MFPNGTVCFSPVLHLCWYDAFVLFWFSEKWNCITSCVSWSSKLSSNLCDASQKSNVWQCDSMLFLVMNLPYIILFYSHTFQRMSCYLILHDSTWILLCRDSCLSLISVYYYIIFRFWRIQFKSCASLLCNDVNVHCWSECICIQSQTVLLR